jgi:hypothetical protein
LDPHGLVSYPGDKNKYVTPPGVAGIRKKFETRRVRRASPQCSPRPTAGNVPAVGAKKVTCHAGTGLQTKPSSHPPKPMWAQGANVEQKPIGASPPPASVWDLRPPASGGAGTPVTLWLRTQLCSGGSGERWVRTWAGAEVPLEGHAALQDWIKFENPARERVPRTRSRVTFRGATGACCEIASTTASSRWRSKGDVARARRTSTCARQTARIALHLVRDRNRRPTTGAGDVRPRSATRRALAASEPPPPWLVGILVRCGPPPKASASRGASPSAAPDPPSRWAAELSAQLRKALGRLPGARSPVLAPPLYEKEARLDRGPDQSAHGRGAHAAAPRAGLRRRCGRPSLGMPATAEMAVAGSRRCAQRCCGTPRARPVSPRAPRGGRVSQPALTLRRVSS